MKHLRKLSSLLTILLISALSLSACLDEEDSEYDDYNYYDEYSQDDWYPTEGSAENQQDPYSEGALEYYSQESSQTPNGTGGYNTTQSWQQLYPNGSAGELSGTIAVVSIFVNTNGMIWDFNDAGDLNTYSKAFYDLKYATEYIQTQCANYGKEVNFVWDWTENKNLYYTTTLNLTINDVLLESNHIFNALWEFIDKNVDNDGIRQSLNADSIVYMAYLDAPEGNTQPSCARNIYVGMPYPYEICLMQMRDTLGLTVPSTFAHEMLHTFGAPDLYSTDVYSAFRLEYGLTKEFTNYVKSIELNDIMRVTHDLKTGTYLQTSISQEITEITAYYTGLIDHSDIVDQWGFDPSQHLER